MMIQSNVIFSLLLHTAAVFIQLKSNPVGILLRFTNLSTGLARAQIYKLIFTRFTRFFFTYPCYTTT